MLLIVIFEREKVCEGGWVLNRLHLYTCTVRNVSMLFMLRVSVLLTYIMYVNIMYSVHPRRLIHEYRLGLSKYMLQMHLSSYLHKVYMYSSRGVMYKCVFFVGKKVLFCNKLRSI